MTFSYQRRYTGPVRAVILDWAGTAVDHGCRAPVGVFIEVFRQHQVQVTEAQARGPMGTHKREHIRQMCAMPEIAAAWSQAHGTAPTEVDVDQMYEEIGPLAIAALADYADPIPGVVKTVGLLRQRNIRIGSTTGYNREMLDVLEAAAADRGYAPDTSVAASEVPAGRPSPFLCWEAAMRLGVWPAEACVKVGDTPVDVEAGLAAGMWSIGVALTGNQVGLSAEAMAALPEAEHDTLAARARTSLARAGAHYVIDRVEQLPAVLHQIEDRLARGERP